MNKAKLNYFVDMLLAVAFVLVAITGILKFPGWFGYLQLPWRTLSKIHDWSGIAMAVLVLIHLILHWNWIVSMTKSIFKGKEE
jgi:hypothetical protein